MTRLLNPTFPSAWRYFHTSGESSVPHHDGEHIEDEDLDEICRQLDVDGYAVLPRMIPPEIIALHMEAVAELVREYDLFAPGMEQPHHTTEEYTRVLALLDRIQRESDATRAICFAPALQSLTRRRFGMEMVVRQPRTGCYAPIDPAYRSTTPHHDYIGMATPDPWESELRVWCALEDISLDAGPLFIIPGSHQTISSGLQDEILRNEAGLRRDLVTAMEPGVGPDAYLALMSRLFARSYEELTRRIEQETRDTVILNLRKGDVAVFNPSLVHGTCPRRDPMLERWHLIFFIAAAKTKWYSWRGWWGTLHDHRRPENSVRFLFEETPHGYMISNHAAAYDESLYQAILPGA